VSILLSLTPFFVFFALMRLHSPLAGLVGALLASALLCARERRRGQAMKVLEVGSLALFALLTAYTLAATPEWTVATVRLAVDLGLLAIALVSLAIRRPFTLQYARETVPEAFWQMPVFYTANRNISAVWAGAFAALVAADALAEWVPAVPLWVDVAGSVAAFAVAVWFSRWYPVVVRRRTMAAGPAKCRQRARLSGPQPFLVEPP
jgi:hypothetical protein